MGYGIVKFCEMVSKEKEKSGTNMWNANKTALKDILTSKCLQKNSQEIKAVPS
ncbi:MAG: hypothetical protein PV340_04415 [Wolbachia sp.]|nr:hypothetical protein [Wolbachia sp.]MDD9336070.1 hypothetical protein [Wolbachia sp.]